MAAIERKIELVKRLGGGKVLVLCGYCGNRVRKRASRWRELKSCGCRSANISGPNNPNRRPQGITYLTRHERIWSDYGRATDQICIDCGASPGVPKEWSYEGGCLEELRDTDAVSHGSPYCGNTSHTTCYVPRCRGGCHKQYDRLMREPIRVTVRRSDGREH